MRWNDEEMPLEIMVSSARSLRAFHVAPHCTTLSSWSFICSTRHLSLPLPLFSMLATTTTTTTTTTKTAITRDKKNLSTRTHTHTHTHTHTQQTDCTTSQLKEIISKKTGGRLPAHRQMITWEGVELGMHSADTQLAAGLPSIPFTHTHLLDRLAQLR